MGILEWLGLRREAPKNDAPSVSTPAQNPPIQQAGKPVSSGQEPKQQQAEVPSFKKPADWRLPRDDLRFKSDSEKINYILQGVYSIYDELKPMADDGTRVSRLQLLLENLTPYEREQARRTIEDLDIDNLVIKFLDYPKSIEEISESIRKSYGYTAARLRHLRSIGRVARLRDPVTNKYKYTIISKQGEGDRPGIPDELLPGSLEAVPDGEVDEGGPFPEGNPFSGNNSVPEEKPEGEPLGEPIILEQQPPFSEEENKPREEQGKSPESPV